MTSQLEVAYMIIQAEKTDEILQAGILEALNPKWHNVSKDASIDTNNYEYRLKPEPRTTYYRVLRTNKGIETYELRKPFPKWWSQGVYTHIHDFQIEE